jgi:hypothetical protein
MSSTFRSGVAIAAAFMALFLMSASPAAADTITYIVNGIIGANSFYNNGIDDGGIFGPVGGSLVGDRFLVTWTASSDCECIGAAGNPFIGDNYPLPNPIIDVMLTINQITYDFGGGGSYGEFYLVNGDLQQAGYYSGNIIGTNQGCCTANGAFKIYLNNGGTLTAGVFIGHNVGVPGPIAGAGLPGLIFASGGLLAWWRRKQKVVAIAL